METTADIVLCMQVTGQQQQQQQPPQPRRAYLSHGDVAWPFLYMGIMGGICSLGVLPWWLILLILVPVYIGGVQIVIVKGAQCSAACRSCCARCSARMQGRCSWGAVRVSQGGLDVFSLQGLESRQGSWRRLA